MWKVFGKTEFTAPIPDAAELVALRHLVGRWRLAPSRDVATHSAGPARSRFRGRGMEFEEVRNYQAGDDIRHMDWKVTARSGRPHIKLFREERERPVYLLVDYSPAMFFGTRNCLKSTLAARLATLLAWSAAEHHDRIGGIVFSSNRQDEFRPRAGKRGVMQLIHFLVSEQHLPGGDLGGRADMSWALQRLHHVVRPGSMIFLISDFANIGPELQLHLSRLRRHCEVTVLQLSDPMEQQLPPPGRYPVTDGHQVLVLDSSSTRLRQSHQDSFQQRQAMLQEILRKTAVPSLHLRTSDKDYAQRLRDFLRHERYSGVGG